jgi:hypothetical protein
MKLEYEGKYIYLITGFEALLNNSIMYDTLYIPSSVYDPPTLCYEWINVDTHKVCNDRRKCWHCLNPPPPPAEPTVRYRKPNN